VEGKLKWIADYPNSNEPIVKLAKLNAKQATNQLDAMYFGKIGVVSYS